MILGYKGIPFEKQVVSICRLCPAGALEAGVPYSVQSLLEGHGWMMSGLKTGILLAFLAAMLFVHRPWCRIFCPLGGLLALFNRFSLFHLRFNPQQCVECNLCRSRCAMGVKVDQAVNVSGCIRCLTHHLRRHRALLRAAGRHAGRRSAQAVQIRQRNYSGRDASPGLSQNSNCHFIEQFI